jgi:hypothetical protein
MSTLNAHHFKIPTAASRGVGAFDGRPAGPS